jgi:hypothetical protein
MVKHPQATTKRSKKECVTMINTKHQRQKEGVREMALASSIAYVLQVTVLGLETHRAPLLFAAA